MIKILVFMGIVLSIVKANGWIVVPESCIWFCWTGSAVGVLVYFFVANIREQIASKLEEKLKSDGRCPVCGHKAGGAGNA